MGRGRGGGLEWMEWMVMRNTWWGLLSVFLWVVFANEACGGFGLVVLGQLGMGLGCRFFVWS